MNPLRRPLAVLALLLASLSAHAEGPALQQKPLLGGHVLILMPSEFKPLSEELLVTKYPTADRPTLAYSNERTTVNVTLKHTTFAVKPTDVPAVFEEMQKQFKALMPAAQWLRAELTQINGRQFFFMDIRTPAIDTRVRNIMVGTSLDNRLLMITFNCTEALEGEWMPTGNKIIRSIVVKD